CIMNAHKLDDLTLISSTTNNDEEYSIPLDISDIITVCREFNKLGYQIQNQVEQILEVGVEESIKSGNVKRESLPHIKSFVRTSSKNAYFDDAVIQSHDCIKLIQAYEEKHKFVYAAPALI